MFIALVCVSLAQVPMTPLGGTVVGPGGEPVIGAELILVGLPSSDPPIVARGKSGEGGRFSLDRPTALAGDHDPQRAPILWAVKPGFRLAAARFPEALPRADEPVRIVLEPPGKAEVRVEGPDGQPLVGVKVLPQRLKTLYTTVPDAVAELAQATTGPDGLAILDAVSPDELTYVDVHSREFGIQGRPIVTSAGKPAVIAMRPASTWKGRLSATDPRHPRGWRVRAYTRVGGGDLNAEHLTTGFVETTTDGEGRFGLAPIAVGGLQLDLKPPGPLPVVADLPRSLTVREGREDAVDIPLRSTATVTGLVLEKGTGKPVPGVLMWLSYLGNRDGFQTVTTDEQGRYAFQSLPGLARLHAQSFPPTHVMAPSQGWEDFTVPEPPRVIELAPREALPAAPPLRGQVVDEAGHPVPAASIQGSWMLAGGKVSSSGNINTQADNKGGFVLEGLAPGSTVTITARHRDRQSKNPIEVRADQPGPLKVAIAPIPVLAVAGRVLGPGGTPLAGIPVKVQSRVSRNNFPGFPEEARFDGNPEIKTGPGGSFKTPKELERKPGEFRIEVALEGFLPGRTAWVPVSEGDFLTLPDLTLKRSRGVRIVPGRVVDRSGKSVPGASVSQAGDGPRWSSVRTDAEGRFRLPGVSAGAALVFAEAQGFRFGGAIIGDGADPVEIHLARLNEPPMASLKTLPPPLSRTEERALATELLKPLLPRARSGELGNAASTVIGDLARVDPARVLEMIENRAVADLSGTLIQVALGRFEADPASAIATIQDDLDPGSRAAGWLALEAYRPAPDRALSEELLERALADSRPLVRGEAKVKLLGQIADRWLELGSIEKARPILLEGQQIVAAWPKDQWFFDVEQFAEVLAAIDLPAATTLFERRGWTNVSRTDAATISRHKLAAAVRLAGIDPALAERLIAPPAANVFDRPRIVLTIARKMAKADLARARRLIETLDDESSPGQPSNRALVPYGLGMMANELAAENPVQARELLDGAFAGLRKLALDECTGQGQDSVARLMAELLPVVERIDPERLAERVWLAAASRCPSAQEPKDQDLEGTFTLAMLISRYERAIADVIAAAYLERLPDLLLLGPNWPYNHAIPSIARSLTAYDPRLIAPLLKSLPEAARKPPPGNNSSMDASIDAQVRQAAAHMLSLPSAVRPGEVGQIGF